MYSKEELSKDPDLYEVVNEKILKNLCKTCTNMFRQNFHAPDSNYGEFTKMGFASCLLSSNNVIGGVFECSHYNKRY